MNSDMEENLIRVVLDTNVLVSAVLFGGKPEEILNFVIEKKVLAVASLILIAELEKTFNKKFPLREIELRLIVNNIEKKFRIVHPTDEIKLSRDEDDNRVLEAALEGKCDYIVTGDRDLLELKTFKNIKILTPDDFLDNFLAKKERGEI